MNRLNLPREMLDTIKAYLFYDTKTYHIIQRAKKQKQITNDIINNAEMSRANNFGNNPYYMEDDEVWSFGFRADHPTEDLQLQAMNCYYCGNYKEHYNSYIHYADRIYCICPPEHEAQYYNFTEDDLYSHDNSDDEIDELEWYHEDYDY